MGYLVMPAIPDDVIKFLELTQEFAMKLTGSYAAYEQVATPSAGGTTPAGKDSANCDDALGKPGRFSRNASTAPVVDSDAELKATIEKQLGSNGYQCAGFHPEKVSPAIAPRRGFKSSE